MGVGVELLEFDLGFEAVLGFHDYVYQFVPVGVPFFDATEVTGAVFVVDDEGHPIVAQAFFCSNIDRSKLPPTVDRQEIFFTCSFSGKIV